jgi:RNA-binding protein
MRPRAIGLPSNRPVSACASLCLYGEAVKSSAQPHPEMIELTPAERRLLKAHAHKLHPVVMIGDKGLTEAVLRAIDENLKSHELIKVKVAGEDRTARDAVLARICEALDASPVQQIGKVLVLYRENPTPPPAPKPAPARPKATAKAVRKGKPNAKAQRTQSTRRKG